jgi:ABC-type branched-subunit amino acid transport system ATPase component
VEEIVISAVMVGAVTAPREGRIAIFGTETTRLPPFRIAGLGVGYVPEGRKIFANLTVEENLKVPIVRPGHGQSSVSINCSQG